MGKKQYYVISVLSFLLVLSLSMSCGKLKNLTGGKSGDSKTKDKTESKEKNGKLYFCEDYVQGEEINVSEKFTTGRLTVMVKMDQEIPDQDVKIRMDKLMSDGTKETVKTVSFTIPVTDYIYFKSEELAFTNPGKYRVTLIGKNGDPIVSGDVTIIEK
jgi:hypothetical protein